MKKNNIILLISLCGVVLVIIGTVVIVSQSLNFSFDFSKLPQVNYPTPTVPVTTPTPNVPTPTNQEEPILTPTPTSTAGDIILPSASPDNTSDTDNSNSEEIENDNQNSEEFLPNEYVIPDNDKYEDPTIPALQFPNQLTNESESYGDLNSPIGWVYSFSINGHTIYQVVKNNSDESKTFNRLIVYGSKGNQTIFICDYAKQTTVNPYGILNFKCEINNDISTDDLLISSNFQ